MQPNFSQRTMFACQFAIALAANLPGSSFAQTQSDLPTSTYQTIHRFSLKDGWLPTGGLASDRWGHSYGVTQNNGGKIRHGIDQFGCGTIYRTSATAGTPPQTIHVFNGARDGCMPESEVFVDDDGTLYGITIAGGASSQGTAYRLRPDGHFDVLHIFELGSGAISNPLVRGTDGYLYGTTQTGGEFGRGTIYKISPAGSFETIYAFKLGGPVGNMTAAGLIERTPGIFYGTAVGGKYGSGTVFKMDSDGEVAVVHSFDGTDGDLPVHLSRDANGDLYGSCIAGGKSGLGVIYKISGDDKFTVMHSFDGADGATVNVAPVRMSDGNFYGTTLAGGDSGVEVSAGTIFRMSDAGDVTTIHSFHEGTSDGYFSLGPLAEGADGSVYGTTHAGGNRKAQGNGTGTIFRFRIR